MIKELDDTIHALERGEPRFNSAIHFLRLFRDTLIGKSPYDNPPIDYSEMKIREPYWIEQDNGGYIYGGWEIPEDNRTDDYGEYLLMQSGKKLRRFDASWQAYRKERK